MSQHSALRKRTEQHKPKNNKSKIDDKEVYQSMELVRSYLKAKKEFQVFFQGEWDLEFSKDIKIKNMIEFIKRKKIRREFNYEFLERSIVPDGGILYLTNRLTGDLYPLVIAEIKRQGTNNERLAEGKSKQATGNAIERLGKNLIGVRAMMNYEKITPFVCFGWGCDFKINSEETGTVRSKVVMMNEFYDLNKIYVFKKDGSADVNDYAPVSMFFREERWSIEEMYDIMKEIAEASIRYYLY